MLFSRLVFSVGGRFMTIDMRANSNHLKIRQVFSKCLDEINDLGVVMLNGLYNVICETLDVTHGMLNLLVLIKC